MSLFCGFLFSDASKKNRCFFCRFLRFVLPLHLMQRYFVYLQYDGTAYHGWQVQPNGDSVQGILQGALSTLLRQEVPVVGAGRTDAGVHARLMVAHFDVETVIDTSQLVYKLNRLLPRDISIDRIVPVAESFHARFSAISRTYHYYIHQQKNPFLRHYSCELRYALDFDAMNEAAARLLEVEDFGAFCKAGSDVKTTLCRVTEAQWTAVAGTEGAYCFVITANRFLRNMVRAVVGTLVDVGRGRITLGEFDRIVAGKRRMDAGDSMPGNALFLWDVKYGLENE